MAYRQTELNRSAVRRDSTSTSWRIDRAVLCACARHDRTQARALVEAWTVAPLSCLTRGRAYAGDALRA